MVKDASSTRPAQNAPSLVQRCQRLPPFLAWGVLVVSSLVLTGWATGSFRFQTLFVGHVTVKPNTALCLALTALVVLILDSPEVRARRTAALLVRMLASICILIGVVTIYGYMFDRSLPIENFLQEALGDNSGTGRMALLSGFEFVGLGTAFLFFDVETEGGLRPIEPILIGVGAVALMALIGYVYGGIPLAGPGMGIQIAVPTAVCIVALSAGGLSLNPDRGWVGAFLSQGSGGVLARRMLPFVFGVPFCLGALRLLGTLGKDYSDASVSSFVAVVTMVAFGAVTAYAARALNEVDRRREDIDVERRSLAKEREADLIEQHRKSHVAARAKDEEQLRAKDEILSHVSHELRTPLAAAQQFVTIVLDGIGGDLRDEQREYLGIVFRNLKQLQAMISDLLDTTRARGGKLTIDMCPLEIHAILIDLFQILEGPAALKGLTLELVTSEVPRMWGDATRVRQILTNVLENAIKFSETGAITVRAGVDPTNPELVLVTVTDSGAGIPPESIDRIFDRLFQVGADVDSGRRGLGLGLYICRELATRMGGRLWAQSVLGEGTTIFLTLPLFAGQTVAGTSNG